MSEPRHPIRIGSSGWSYPDWEGSFYPVGMPAADYLTYYADRFPTVEVDSSFYRTPSAGMVRAWRSRTPDDFRFALKVPRVITHEKALRGCRAEVEGFAAAIEPLGAKLSVALLQLGYFNRSVFADQAAFLSTLDAFLADWPHHAVPLAVEVRNPRWVNDDLLGVLRAHGAAFTLTEQKWMPSPRKILENHDPLTGPLAFVRLLGDREAIEKLAQTWDRLVLDRSASLAETAGVIETLAARAPVFVFANNHYAGHAPATIKQLRGMLGQPEPEPPERPRTTLFD